MSGLFAFQPRQAQHDYTQSASLGDTELKIAIADTETKLAQGLSRRSELANDQAMLFVHNQIGESCMWMKDMNFSLDVLWLNDDYKVIDYEENLSPSSYPQSFCSNVPARYFLEVKAGFISSNSIKNGTKLNLD